MKVNVLQTIKNYEGKDMTNDSGGKMSLRDVISTALNNLAPEEKSTAELQNKAFQLSLKIYSTNDPDLSVDERSLILERVSKIYPSPIVSGRMRQLFEEK